MSKWIRHFKRLPMPTENKAKKVEKIYAI